MIFIIRLLFWASYCLRLFFNDFVPIFSHHKIFLSTFIISESFMKLLPLNDDKYNQNFIFFKFFTVITFLSYVWRYSDELTWSKMCFAG